MGVAWASPGHTGALRAWYHLSDTREERLSAAEAGGLLLLPLCPVAGTRCVTWGRSLALSVPHLSLPMLLECFWEGSMPSGRSSAGTSGAHD